MAHSIAGSPFGFKHEDFETIGFRRSQVDVLHVVFGHQFESPHYNSEQLKKQVESWFNRALDWYVKNVPSAHKATLEFRSLGAGYGEHLFNQIARDIAAADIAVFDTSDLNPNVMIELGMAIMAGVRVLTIREQGCPWPPSDIQGLTWFEHADSGAKISDDKREEIGKLIERALRAKFNRERTSSPA